MPISYVRRANGKMLAAALVGALVAWFGIVGYVFLNSRERIDRSETAVVALCALRVDLDKRIESSEALLYENPSGTVFGIPRSVITSSLQNSRRTRKTLNILDCKE